MRASILKDSETKMTYSFTLKINPEPQEIKQIIISQGERDCLTYYETDEVCIKNSSPLNIIDFCLFWLPFKNGHNRNDISYLEIT